MLLRKSVLRVGEGFLYPGRQFNKIVHKYPLSLGYRYKDNHQGLLVKCSTNIPYIHERTLHLQGSNPSALSVRRKGTVASRIVASSPFGLQPYLKLARLDKPVGTWLLFWPCGWSIGLAGVSGALPNLQLLALFGAGAFVMRGAGCTINDMWDRNIDSAVERTRDRPIASGKISLFDSLVFLGGQLGVGILILLELNWYSVVLGVSSMGLVVLYPLMKRVTHYPQLILGLTFNWGALLGWSAAQGFCNWSVCLSLYSAGICWTMIYDTIYAHQDKYDDIIIGMKSTAIKFGEQTPICLSCFATMMGLSLTYSGWLCEQTWPYYTSIAAVLAHISHQIYTLDINDGEDCAKKFLSNRWVGLILFLGCIGGTYCKDERTESSNVSEILQQATKSNKYTNIVT
jgi:4-hydroxybenzoate polyprenyltransferase